MVASPLGLSSKVRHGEFPESPCGTEVSIEHERWQDVIIQGPRRESSPSSKVRDYEELLMSDDLTLEFESLNYIWRFCVGLTGALDIMACILPGLVRSHGYAIGKKAEIYLGAPSTAHGALTDLSAFLDRHDNSISFIFSAMWVADAFLAAHARRESCLLQEERTRCLESDRATEQGSYWWKSPSFVYYRTIVIQLLLLPVGFYLLIFYAMDCLNWEAIPNLDHVPRSMTFKVITADHKIEYEAYLSDSRISVLFAVIQYVVLKVTGSTARVLRCRTVSYMKRISPVAIKTVMSTAIRNPRRFRRRLRKVITLVRWIKYLTPLIGAVNKLKGNVDDMLKKRRQRRIAEKQRSIRRLLWEKTPIHMRQEGAAVKIQCAYRAHRSRTFMKALKLVHGNAKYLATVTVQRALRDSLFRARRRLRKKTLEYKRLCVDHQDKKKNLDQETKKRFFELRDELCDEAERLINRRLLLRPNTRFAVAWKMLFIVCIVVEVGQLASKPWLESYQDHGKSQPLTMPEFIALSFVPTRASQRKECRYLESKGWSQWSFFFERKHGAGMSGLDVGVRPWYCTHPASTIQEAYSDAVSLLLVPAPVSKWPECSEIKKRRWRGRGGGDNRRWYCHQPYSSLHSMYRDMIDFLMDKFLIIIGLVCFLDVFVTFFTGELDGQTGELIPKPFFARWVLPGLVLQLLLNPQLGTFAEGLSSLWERILDFGPIRVLRWSVTTIVPLALYLSKKFIRYIWMPLVKYQNEVATMVDEIF
jgi:hypothetical protein